MKAKPSDPILKLQNRLSSIEKQLASVKFLENVDLFTTMQNKFYELVDQAKNSETDLSAYVQSAKTAAEEANAIKTSIAATSQSLETDSQVLKDLLGSTEALQEELRSYLGEMSNKSLAVEFKERAGALEENVKKWFNWLLGAIGLVLALTIGAALWQFLSEDSFFRIGLAFKTAITLPAIYFLYFCAAQYGREKQLLEEYAFKGAVSRSLNANREIIQSVISAAHEPIQPGYREFVEFLIKSVADVYAPPSETIKNFSKVDHLPVKISNSIPNSVTESND